MAKVGDIVRFLNATGGGRITRIEGRIAYVDDDGFETPTLIGDLVVVAPAESQQARVVAAEEKAMQPTASPASSQTATPTHTPYSEPEPDVEVEETEYGDSISLQLAYEPEDIKQLSTTKFFATIVNDSNYWLDLSYLISYNGEDWALATQTVIEPNMQTLVDEIDRSRLSEMTHIAVQFTAYKRGKTFKRKLPVWVERKMDMTKFFKLHCFKPSVYSDAPVLAIDLMLNDELSRPLDINSAELQNSLNRKKQADLRHSRPVTRRDKRPDKTPDTIEVDLHINELLDSTRGMTAADILNYQIDTFRRVMEANAKNKGKKIIFIHGKGDGVLRKAIEKELSHRYKQHQAQDASFREYGFGATQVTIR